MLCLKFQAVVWDGGTPWVKAQARRRSRGMERAVSERYVANAGSQ